MIKAEVIADSICNGHRITTQKVTFPRIILAEKNTHRMFSRNSASSRAIPFRKMIKMVMENPFIPIAWQRDHTGMQGKEYLDPTETYSLNDYLPIMQMELNQLMGGDAEKETVESVGMYQRLLERYDGKQLTLSGWWLEARDRVVEVALLMSVFQVTKQLCNRLLEPFMWHTVLVTATEWENFFHLRCPIYEVDLTKHRAPESPTGFGEKRTFRSRKDVKAYLGQPWENKVAAILPADDTDLYWLQQNKGQAEIHMMALAEAMWDARNESIPKELLPGQWHIPYAPTSVELKEAGVEHIDMNGIVLKIATARCAQTSYTTVGEEGKALNVDNLVDLHNSLLVRPYTNRKGVVFGPDDPIHMSPFEHCAQAMTEEEFCGHLRGTTSTFIDPDGTIGIHERYVKGMLGMPKTQDHPFGWCHNLRGWKSYRSMIPNENRR